MIVKVTGENLSFLSANEAKLVAFAMEQVQDLSIDQVSKAFGLRPVHRSDAEIIRKVLTGSQLLYGKSTFPLSGKALCTFLFWTNRAKSQGVK